MRKTSRKNKLLFFVEDETAEVTSTSLVKWKTESTDQTSATGVPPANETFQNKVIEHACLYSMDDAERTRCSAHTQQQRNDKNENEAKDEQKKNEKFQEKQNRKRQKAKKKNYEKSVSVEAMCLYTYMTSMLVILMNFCVQFGFLCAYFQWLAFAVLSTLFRRLMKKLISLLFAVLSTHPTRRISFLFFGWCRTAADELRSHVNLYGVVVVVAEHQMIRRIFRQKKTKKSLAWGVRRCLFNANTYQNAILYHLMWYGMEWASMKNVWNQRRRLNEKCMTYEL